MTGMIVPDQSPLSGGITERDGVFPWKRPGAEQLREHADRATGPLPILNLPRDLESMERRGGPDLHTVAAWRWSAEEARGVSHKDFDR